MGSFVRLVADRAGTGLGVTRPRSRCDACGTALAARDLVPLLSWAASAGKARCCGARLSAAHPLTELAALAIAVWALWQTTGLVLYASLVLGWTLIALSLIDLRLFRLPDAGTLPLIAVGLALSVAGLTGPPPAHAAGAAVGYGLIWSVATLYRRLRGIEGLGLGDAKLLAAAGAWVGVTGLPSVLLWACAGGLLHALARSGGALHGGLAIPFGPALALGFWITWLHGPLTL